MERESTKHGPKRDDELKAEMSGQLDPAKGHREEWRETEPEAEAEPHIERDEGE